MAYLKLNPIPYEFLQLQYNLEQREGHHYHFFDNAEYPTELKLTTPRYFQGMTITLLLYNKDGSGESSMKVEWSSNVGQKWSLRLYVKNTQVLVAGQERFNSVSKSSPARLPPDAVYSLGIRALSKKYFQGVLNGSDYTRVNVENVFDYDWTLHLRAYKQYLIGMHITNEVGERPSDYWGRASYLRHIWLPRGTIGIYTCQLVDENKETYFDHWVGPKGNDNVRIQFDHANIKSGTRLYYTVRLSATTYVFSCSFDDRVFVEKSSEPNYIQPNFTSAMNIINFDLEVPYPAY